MLALLFLVMPKVVSFIIGVDEEEFAFTKKHLLGYLPKSYRFFLIVS